MDIDVSIDGAAPDAHGARGHARDADGRRRGAVSRKATPPAGRHDHGRPAARPAPSRDPHDSTVVPASGCEAVESSTPTPRWRRHGRGPAGRGHRRTAGRRAARDGRRHGGATAAAAAGAAGGRRSGGAAARAARRAARGGAGRRGAAGRGRGGAAGGAVAAELRADRRVLFNGADDDCDGNIDCADSDCTRDRAMRAAGPAGADRPDDRRRPRPARRTTPTCTRPLPEPQRRRLHGMLVPRRRPSLVQRHDRQLRQRRPTAPARRRPAPRS